MKTILNRGSAAIVCGHVANRTHSILLAMRTEQVHETDSGWQFLCNKNQEQEEDAKVWAISEVLEMEPSLEIFIDSPEGTTIIRDDPQSEWRIE